MTKFDGDVNNILNEYINWLIAWQIEETRSEKEA